MNIVGTYPTLVRLGYERGKTLGGFKEVIAKNT